MSGQAAAVAPVFLMAARRRPGAAAGEAGQRGSASVDPTVASGPSLGTTVSSAQPPSRPKRVAALSASLSLAMTAAVEPVELAPPQQTSKRRRSTATVSQRAESAHAVRSPSAPDNLDSPLIPEVKLKLRFKVPRPVTSSQASQDSANTQTIPASSTDTVHEADRPTPTEPPPSTAPKKPTSLLETHSFFLTKEQRRHKRMLENEEKLKQDIAESAKSWAAADPSVPINPFFLQACKPTAATRPAGVVAKSAGKPKSFATAADAPFPSALNMHVDSDYPPLTSGAGVSYFSGIQTASSKKIHQVLAAEGLNDFTVEFDKSGSPFISLDAVSIDQYLESKLGGPLHPGLRKLRDKLFEHQSTGLLRDDIGREAWVDRYRPASSVEVLGSNNAESVAKLKGWLQNWRPPPSAAAEEVAPYGSRRDGRARKRARRGDDDDDDFVVDDDDFGESGSYSGAARGAATHIRLVGRPGSGRTTAVMAVAAECGYDVLEINSGQRRGGKDLAAILAEATQSHTVIQSKRLDIDTNLTNLTSKAPTAKPPSGKGKPKAARSGKRSDATKKKKVKRRGFISDEEDEHEDEPSRLTPDREQSQATCRPCLILIEDIDVVFDDDKGFWSNDPQPVSAGPTPIALDSYSAALQFRRPSALEAFCCLHLILMVEAVWLHPAQLRRLCADADADLRHGVAQLHAWTADARRVDIAAENATTAATIDRRTFALIGFASPSGASPWGPSRTPAAWRFAPDILPPPLAVEAKVAVAASEHALRTRNCSSQDSLLARAARWLLRVDDSVVGLRVIREVSDDGDRDAADFAAIADAADAAAYIDAHLTLSDAQRFEIDEPDVYYPVLSDAVSGGGAATDAPHTPPLLPPRFLAKTFVPAEAGPNLALAHLLTVPDGLVGWFEVLAGRVFRERCLSSRRQCQAADGGEAWMPDDEEDDEGASYGSSPAAAAALLAATQLAGPAAQARRRSHFEDLAPFAAAMCRWDLANATRAASSPARRLRLLDPDPDLALGRRRLTRRAARFRRHLADAVSDDATAEALARFAEPLRRRCCEGGEDGGDDGTVAAGGADAPAPASASCGVDDDDFRDC
ncbi:ATPase AAA domain-containing protein 5 [Cladochytrium tenue]|nr:ATPase AAA domain-containing protein 5 [Cladochytrium tenue]